MSKDRFFFELLRGHRLLRALGLSPIEKKLVITSVGGRWTYESIKEQARTHFAGERAGSHGAHAAEMSFPPEQPWSQEGWGEEFDGFDMNWAEWQPASWHEAQW